MGFTTLENTHMSNTQLTDEQIKALAQYLITTRKTLGEGISELRLSCSEEEAKSLLESYGLVGCSGCATWILHDDLCECFYYEYWYGND